MKLAQPKSFAIFKIALLSSLITIAGASATQVMAENTHPQIVAQASPTVQFYCGKTADPSNLSSMRRSLIKDRQGNKIRFRADFI